MPAKLNMKSNRHWVSLVPYGLNQQHPNAYKDILSTIWENRDNLGYAYRILRDGCCDGCRTAHRWMPSIVQSRIPVVPSAQPSQQPSRRMR